MDILKAQGFEESEIISILAELVRIDMVSINEIIIIYINQDYHYFH